MTDVPDVIAVVATFTGIPGPGAGHQHGRLSGAQRSGAGAGGRHRVQGCRDPKVRIPEVSWLPGVRDTVARWQGACPVRPGPWARPRSPLIRLLAMVATAMMTLILVCPLEGQRTMLLELQLQEADYCIFSGEGTIGPSGNALSATLYADSDIALEFNSEAEAFEVLREMLRHAGLGPGRIPFKMAASQQVPNALAVVHGYDSERLILYNPHFMRGLRNRTNTSWSMISVLAHEIGHHLWGHTLTRSSNRRDLELEADFFSGDMLYKMGATLEEATAAYRSFSPSGSASHPGRDQRVQAATDGWNNARDLHVSGGSTDHEPPATPDPGASGRPSTVGPNDPVLQSPADYVLRAVFYNDQAQYYVTPDDRIIGVSVYGQQAFVGHRVPSSDPQFAWMYQAFAGVTYGVTPQGLIVGTDMYGQYVQVGYVTEMRDRS